MPDNSIIRQVIISPFDHWLSMEEAKNEIRGFVKNPTEELQKRFYQNEEKNLRFITEYLKSRQFFFVETVCTEFREDKNEYKRIFYSCTPESNFYESVQDIFIFLPILNVSMEINDDYSIRFEILHTGTSESEIESIVLIAKNSGLFVKECK